MPVPRIYLQKNDTSKNDKIPYFTLKLVPEEGKEDQDWKEIGVLWKAKSGVGYTGLLSNGAELDLSKYTAREQKKAD